MNGWLIVSLLGLGLLGLVMIGTTIKDIHDKLRDAAREDRDYE
jgi:hypothetical protein